MQGMLCHPALPMTEGLVEVKGAELAGPFGQTLGPLSPT